MKNYARWKCKKYKKIFEDDFGVLLAR